MKPPLPASEWPFPMNERTTLPPLTGDILCVRGGGDLATGVVQKLARSGMRVVVLETAQPTVIRRTVALAVAAVEGEARVEDILCRRVDSCAQLVLCWEQGIVPLLIDPECRCLEELRPHGLIDAIIAKRNLGTHRAMAAVTLALGPGFRAPEEVDGVIETMRGHDLGRLVLDGEALPNTGTPGVIGGAGAQRVVHAPVGGTVRHVRAIGDKVEAGEPLFYIGDTPVPSPLTGLLRGLIAQGVQIPKGMKAADVDPRLDTDWNTISDKARCLGGAALEGYLYLKGQKSLSR